MMEKKKFSSLEEFENYYQNIEIPCSDIAIIGDSIIALRGDDNKTQYFKKISSNGKKRN